jgi:solute carrier family 10 (sodium/bile acid cotransporter), member 7
MRHWLTRYWFVLLLLAGVLIASLSPRLLLPLTAKLEPRVVVSIALFIMAWTLESRALFRSVLRPAPALWAVILSYGLVPGLAWLAGSVVSQPDLRTGLLLIASVPCTLASAVIWTRMAGGNEATALLVVLLTTALSWLVTTGWLALTTATRTSVDAASMMRDLALVLILPVGVGQACRIVPMLVKTATRFRPVLDVVSRLLILSIILKAAAEVGERVAGKFGELPLVALGTAICWCLVIHLVALGAGFWSSRALRFGRPDQVAVALACSQKTLPVSLYLYDAYFREAYPLAVVPLLAYHFGQLFVDTFIGEALRKNAPPTVTEKRG